MRIAAALLGLALAGLAPFGTASASANDWRGVGAAVEGHDRARLVLPPGARIESYANIGYRLERRGDEAVIEIDARPLESRAPFSLPPMAEESEHAAIPRLARALTSGATTQYEAISQVLAWVARHIEYDLDRQAAQDALSTLDRRRAYCTGVARLSVALLEAVGIPAREVPGYVVGERWKPGQVGGYHRWIEAFLPDRGWVFSDPLNTHHYVPATYVRLADDALETHLGLDGLLLERQDNLTVADVYPAVAEGTTARRNLPRQLAAVLRVEIEQGAGWAELTGRTLRWRRELRDGRTAFIGLDPGEYQLRLHLGDAVLERNVELRGRARQSLFLPAASWRPEPHRVAR